MLNYSAKISCENHASFNVSNSLTNIVAKLKNSRWSYLCNILEERGNTWSFAKKTAVVAFSSSIAIGAAYLAAQPISTYSNPNGLTPIANDFSFDKYHISSWNRYMTLDSLILNYEQQTSPTIKIEQFDPSVINNRNSRNIFLTNPQLCISPQFNIPQLSEAPSFGILEAGAFSPLECKDNTTAFANSSFMFGYKKRDVSDTSNISENLGSSKLTLLLRAPQQSNEPQTPGQFSKSTSSASSGSESHIKEQPVSLSSPEASELTKWLRAFGISFTIVTLGLFAHSVIKNKSKDLDSYENDGEAADIKIMINHYKKYSSSNGNPYQRELDFYQAYYNKNMPKALEYFIEFCEGLPDVKLIGTIESLMFPFGYTRIIAFPILFTAVHRTIHRFLPKAFQLANEATKKTLRQFCSAIDNQIANLDPYSINSIINLGLPTNFTQDLETENNLETSKNNDTSIAKKPAENPEESVTEFFRTLTRDSEKKIQQGEVDAPVTSSILTHPSQILKDRLDNIQSRPYFQLEKKFQRFAGVASFEETKEIEITIKQAMETMSCEDFQILINTNAFYQTLKNEFVNVVLANAISDNQFQILAKQAQKECFVNPDIAIALISIMLHKKFFGFINDKLYTNAEKFKSRLGSFMYAGIGNSDLESGLIEQALVLGIKDDFISAFQKEKRKYLKGITPLDHAKLGTLDAFRNFLSITETLNNHLNIARDLKIWFTQKRIQQFLDKIPQGNQGDCKLFFDSLSEFDFACLVNFSKFFMKPLIKLNVKLQEIQEKLRVVKEKSEFFKDIQILEFENLEYEDKDKIKSFIKYLRILKVKDSLIKEINNDGKICLEKLLLLNNPQEIEILLAKRDSLAKQFVKIISNVRISPKVLKLMQSASCWTLPSCKDEALNQIWEIEMREFMQQSGKVVTSSIFQTIDSTFNPIMHYLPQYRKTLDELIKSEKNAQNEILKALETIHNQLTQAPNNPKPSSSKPLLQLDLDSKGNKPLSIDNK
jgi:hypothetical protein